MAIVIYKPTTSARRQTSVVNSSDITKSRPEKRLTIIRKKYSGRNHAGKITIRHRGGGAKRRIRIIDFKQHRFNIPASVAAIEYDPNRSARIALIQYENGEQSYILAAADMRVGDKIIFSQNKIDVTVGNRMPLEYMPSGIKVHNIELVPGRGGVMARSAGASAELQAIEGDFAQLKMPSGEIRLVKKSCLASVGVVSNLDHRLVRIGKAGRKRHMGIRPTVRGKVMNPVDHPHGGGEGRQPIGLKYPKTPWGKHALGVRTRHNHKTFNRMILSGRKKRIP